MKAETKKRIWESGGMLLTILLACLGAAFLRTGIGIWLMLPVYILCVAAAALLSVPRWQRAVFFLVMVLILNAVENNDTATILFMEGIAIVLFALTEIAVVLFRSKSGKRIFCGVLAILLCLVTNAVAFGNPVSALIYNSSIQSYLNTHYDLKTGGIRVSEIQYSVTTGRYSVTLSNDLVPTDSAEVFFNGSLLEDQYRIILEGQIQEPFALEFLAVLRDAFPNDSFTIYRTGVSGYPRNGLLSAYDTADYANSASYCIELSGKSTLSKLADAAMKYSNALVLGGAHYRSIQFVGTQTLARRWQVSVRPTGFNGIVYQTYELSVYTERSAEQYEFLQRNGLEEFLQTIAS